MDANDKSAFPVRNRPRTNRYGDPLTTGGNAVRAYRASPEEVFVQLRGEKTYTTLSLSFDEAREFARRILVACDD